MYQILIQLLSFFLAFIQSALKSKKNLVIENIALRQQLSIYQTKDITPKFTDFDRVFWISLKQVWAKWIDALVFVKPETVIDWQKRRFKKHWTKISHQNS